tara:strand:- start:295 stop:525 length:231 start_codon:yes stop_codon:yes gene_type:complete
MANGDAALGMVGTAMTLMFGVAMIDYAHRSTKDLMKQGRGKGKNGKNGNNFNIKYAPDFSPPKGKQPPFNPFQVKF